MPHCPATGLPCRWCIEPCAITRPRDPITFALRRIAIALAVALALAVLVTIAVTMNG